MLIIPDSTTKKHLQLSFIIMALTVILGAFGSHGLKQQISSTLLETYQTGVQYCFIHALGIAVIALSSAFIGKNLRVPVYLMLGGILLFSGSLMLYALHELPGLSLLIGLRMSAPIGGLLLILGWLIAVWKLFGK